MSADNFIAITTKGDYHYVWHEAGDYKGIPEGAEPTLREGNRFMVEDYKGIPFGVKKFWSLKEALIYAVRLYRKVEKEMGIVERGMRYFEEKE